MKTEGTYCAAGHRRRDGLIAKVQVLCTHEEMATAIAEIAIRYAAMRSQIEPTDSAAILDLAKGKLR